MISRTLVAIGGGELRTKETLAMDTAIGNLAKKKAGERRANALFVPTASHDSLPYFNTFRKTYTSELDIKVDVALLTKKDIPMEKIEEKIAAADLIYVGGGDTLYLLEVWRRTGFLERVVRAYQNGTILAGLSAGAICWFETMYTDADIVAGVSSSYAIYDGLGIQNGMICPHYNQRQLAFDNEVLSRQKNPAYAVEDNAAIVLQNETLVGALTSGGKAYQLQVKNGVLEKTEIAIVLGGEER